MRRWTQEDRDLLIELYGKEDIASIAERLGRSVFACRDQVHKYLKLKVPPAGISLSRAAAELGVPRHALVRLAQEEGILLHRMPPRRSKSKGVTWSEGFFFEITEADLELLNAALNRRAQIHEVQRETRREARITKAELRRQEREARREAKLEARRIKKQTPCTSCGKLKRLAAAGLCWRCYQAARRLRLRQEVIS